MLAWGDAQRWGTRRRTRDGSSLPARFNPHLPDMSHALLAPCAYGGPRYGGAGSFTPLLCTRCCSSRACFLAATRPAPFSPPPQHGFCPHQQRSFEVVLEELYEAVYSPELTTFDHNEDTGASFTQQAGGTQGNPPPQGTGINKVTATTTTTAANTANAPCYANPP